MGKTPHIESVSARYHYCVDQITLTELQKQRLAVILQPTAAENPSPSNIGFGGAEAKLSRSGRSSYVNHGPTQDRTVRHWLEAETQLPAENKLARVHSLHKRSTNKPHRRLTK